MHTDPLRIATAGGTYDIIVAAGAHARLPALLAELGLVGTLHLISDDAVFAHYGGRLVADLEAAGRTVRTTIVPHGEQSKDLATAATLYDALIGGGVERRDVVLALGGGVVGDLAGFVAATVLRGIAVVQLPTTLLAMIDSAIGGKTGVNHALGKNLIGAFHQPRLVLADTGTLRTLPPRELAAGWAEVIKHAMIRDAALFADLAAAGPQILDAGLIRRAAAVKVAVVNADERETGERMLLNYGHTIGQAVETASGYGVLLHGEAVAIGMHAEAQLAAALGMLSGDAVERQAALLEAYGLPVTIPAALPPSDLLAIMYRDKKVNAGKLRWALPTAIGAARIVTDVPEDYVRAVLHGTA